MKRILHLIKGLTRGGAEQLLVSQMPYLDRSSFEYEIAYLLPDHDALVGELEQHGLTVHCLGGTGSGWIARLRRLVRDRDINLIHDHSPFVAIGSRLGVRRRSAPRLVYTEHNVWEAYHPATYWGNMLTYARGDYVFAVSQHVRASIRYPAALRFLPMPPVETLYHGLDPAAVARWPSSDGVREELGLPKDSPIVGTVANFRPSKGHDILLQAAVRVREAFPSVRFVLVGYGPLEAKIRQLVRDLALEEAVVFTGLRSDAPRVAGAFDVFAMSSVYEGLAIALVEAMALGRPAVVTRAGGLTEVLEHGKQGLVVNPGDPVSLADAIITLLRDEELRQRFGAAGRRRAADFDVRKAVSRHQEVYAELLGS